MQTKTVSPGCLPRLAAYFHRLLGIALLGLAWYACTSGISLQAQHYPQDDKQRLLNIFWGVAGGISGMVFFIGYVIRPEGES